MARGELDADDWIKDIRDIAKKMSSTIKINTLCHHCMCVCVCVGGGGGGGGGVTNTQSH